MRDIDKGAMPDGTKVYIEDWSEDYPGTLAPKATIGAYPKAKVSFPGAFSPKGNERFRAQLDFGSEDEAREAFSRLCAGEAVLADYGDKLWNRKYRDAL
jgi:hypothetical protein